jgi:hypothetical protein
MSIQTRFLNGNGEPLTDAHGRLLITDYVGPLAAGTKLKIGNDEYQIRCSTLELNDADRSLGHSVVLHRLWPSFIASWTNEQKTNLMMAMFILTCLGLGGIIYLIYTSPPLLWVAVGLRFGVVIAIFALGFAISWQVDGSLFSHKQTLLGLYLSCVFLWGGFYLALAWLWFFWPPSPITPWRDPAAYVSYFRKEFDPFQPIAVVALGWLPPALGFIGLTGLEKVVRSLQGKLK